MSSLVLAAAVSAALSATPAEARFGKSSGSSGSSSSSSSGSSSTSSSTRTSSSSSSSSSSGSYHAAVPVGSSSSGGWSTSARSGSRFSFFGPRAVRYGYYSGAFVPAYGYGYCVRSTTVVPYTTSAVATTGVAAQTETVTEEEAGLRVTAGVEGLYLTAGLSGFIFGGGATVEGERWGVTLFGQNIAVKADDGTNGTDNIGVLTARLSFAFLTGKYGRLRVEGGADTVIAPNLVALGPVLGVSGLVWVFGPLALEANAFVVPWPYRELDWRAGVVLGVGPVGIRAGWRTQVLDDRGWVDGVIHRDSFMGPYAGLSVAF
jgi:hypothetical protein